MCLSCPSVAFFLCLGRFLGMLLETKLLESNQAKSSRGASTRISLQSSTWVVDLSAKQSLSFMHAPPANQMRSCNPTPRYHGPATQQKKKRILGDHSDDRRCSSPPVWFLGCDGWLAANQPSSCSAGTSWTSSSWSSSLSHNNYGRPRATANHATQQNPAAIDLPWPHPLHPPRHPLSGSAPPQPVAVAKSTGSADHGP